MATELPVGLTRHGLAWDRECPEGYVSALANTGEAIEWIVATEERDAPPFRRFLKGGPVWGDPLAQGFDEYVLPSTAWFADRDGGIALVGPRDRSRVGFSSIALGEVRAHVDFAVACGLKGVDYTKIHGLCAEIEDLASWLGPSVLRRDLERTTRGIRVIASAEPRAAIEVTRTMRLRLESAYRHSFSSRGELELADVARVRTKLTTTRPWIDHLEIHDSLRHLLEVASWTPHGYRNVWAHRSDDPEIAIGGNTLGPRWGSVFSYRLRRAGERAEPRDYLFGFGDVGAAGVRRWLKLRKDFWRGVMPLLHAVENPVSSLDGGIADAGIGLEGLSVEIARARDEPAGRSHIKHLARVLENCGDVLPFDASNWAERSTNVYNAVKHPERAYPETLEMATVLNQNRLVFRAWVARRLGMSKTRLRRSLSTDPMSRTLHLT